MIPLAWLAKQTTLSSSLVTVQVICTVLTGHLTPMLHSQLLKAQATPAQLHHAQHFRLRLRLVLFALPLSKK